MRPYLSLWSYGYYSSFSEEQKALLYSYYKISSFFLLKHYKEVNLITDLAGKEFLKDIPFTSIDTSLEVLPKNINMFWSLAKLYAYKIISEKGEPFFHIDNDVFLLDKISEDFLNSNIFVQNQEFFAFDHYDVRYFYNIIPNKYLLNKFLPSTSYNLGIFGGNDLNLINEFAEEALKLPLDQENINTVQKTNFRFNFGPACIIEQYQLSIFLNIKNIYPRCLIDLSDRSDKNIAENSMTIRERGGKINYIHYWGSKTDPANKFVYDKLTNYANSIRFKV